MSTPFDKKWLICVQNQFIDDSFYSHLNYYFVNQDIFISKNFNNSLQYINKTINNLINTKIINRNSYTDCKFILFISTLILLKRLTSKYLLSKSMLHKIMIGLFLISEKLNNDDLYDNYTWAHSFNISLKELNSIESSLLYLLDYNIFISRKEFLLLAQLLYN